MSQTVRMLNIDYVLRPRATLMQILLLNCPTKILHKLIRSLHEALVRSEMGQSFHELAHEDLIVGLAKIGMVIVSKLVVSVDQVAQFAHDPLNSVDRANSVRVAVHNRYSCRLYLSDWNTLGMPVLFTLQVGLSILLEAALNAHLEEVSECFGRDGLFSPHSVLVAPLAT